MADDAVELDIDVELLQALEAMIRGTAMLKAGRSGKPHFRQFNLSPDLSKLTWATPKKAGGSGKILMDTAEEVRRGQNTKVFASNRMPEHEHLSFSLISTERTLDVICKDASDYEHWTRGLEALCDASFDRAAVSALLEERANYAKDVSDGGMRVEVRGKSAVLERTENASDLYTWGQGAHGRLGHGDDDDRLVPQVVEALLGQDVRLVACGPDHMAAVPPSGHLYAWGYGRHGRLGMGHERSRVTPLMVTGLRGDAVTAVACGAQHSLAVTADGDVYSWGCGTHGQLGYAATRQRVPRRVDALAGEAVAQVVCGGAASAAVTEDGRLFTWGCADDGHLGHGATGDIDTPTLVVALEGVPVRRVAMGRHHAVALTTDGHVYAWGRGQAYHCRDSTPDDEGGCALTPVQISGLGGVADIACGEKHALCLTESGNVYAWGENAHGQLGVGDREPRRVPMPVPMSTGITQISCGMYHAAVINDRGEILTWGLGANGRLGHGDTQDRLSPSVCTSLTDKSIRAVYCGGAHTAATVVHGWVDDDETDKCMACKASFTMRRRRHHCRRCGGLFCGSCSSRKFPLISLGFAEAVRVCDKCFSIVSGGI